MANLNRLLNDRAQVFRRGEEDTKGGQTYYYAFTDTATGRCQFCWKSPGTGCAVVEVWGSSGGGGRMCCCAGPGVPGNPGAYSRKYTRVCSGTYICGWGGCSVQPTSLCYGGRGNCSVACVFNSGNNGCARSEAGYGGFSRCTTSTSQFRCLACQCQYCSTAIGTYCGIVCNKYGGVRATFAAASSGDLNIEGGISCTRFCTCYNCRSCGYEYTLALSPGVHGQECSPCVRMKTAGEPMNWCNCATHSGRMSAQLGVKALTRTLPQMYPCWSSGNRECACYEFVSCYYNGTGVPGLGGIPCAGVRANPTRGGHGGIKVTFYS